MGIKEKKIDMGHARAILGSPSTEQQINLYQRILKDGLSVRKVEELVSKNKNEPVPVPTLKEHPYQEQEQALQNQLGMGVRIDKKHLTITYRTEEQLQQLISLLAH